MVNHLASELSSDTTQVMPGSGHPPSRFWPGRGLGACLESDARSPRTFTAPSEQTATFTDSLDERAHQNDQIKFDSARDSLAWPSTIRVEFAAAKIQAKNPCCGQPRGRPYP